MKKDLVEIVCIVDKSGSMYPLRDDAIGGINEFVRDQRCENGEAKFSLVMFSAPQAIETIHECADINEVAELTADAFKPGGSTALYDAICKTVDAVGNRLSRTPDEQIPEKVIVVILTDGEENSSKEFKHQDAMERIKHQREKYNWDFVYLGANQDAFQVGGNLGIDYAFISSYNATPSGTRDAYYTSSCSVSKIRNSLNVKTNP